MLFNSIPYLVFLGIVCGLYRVLGLRNQNRMLLGASYLFYAWWDVRFLLLIVLSTVIDYSCALMMRDGRLTSRERATASLWAVVAAVLCVGCNWSALSVGAGSVAIDWAALVPNSQAGLIVAAVVAAVAIVNVLHQPIARLQEDQRRRLLVTISLACNLGLLGFFKYFDFFVVSAEEALRSLGFEPAGFRLGLVLPVGISFYTFQTLSYTIDVYRRQLEPSSRFADVALYVAFFPQLVAGPIERAARLLPILTAPRRLSIPQTLRGLHLILVGLFKKVAIADGMAISVDSIFKSSAPSWIEVVAGTAMFAVQIYCDFSGYTDIARGSAKLLGIDLMVNFELPYFARNPRDFWRRWHISLSTWLRDYLYIPLGGNRGGISRTYRNLMATMVLGGLWHGAAWNFVLWGLYQGALLSGHREFERRREQRRSRAEESRLPTASLAIPSALLAFTLCLAATCYGWLIFRAESLQQIVDFSAILFQDFGNLRFEARPPRLPALMGLPVLIAIEAIQFFRGDLHADTTVPPPVRGLLYAGLLFVLLIGTSNAPAQFIYFAF